MFIFELFQVNLYESNLLNILSVDIYVYTSSKDNNFY